MATTVGDGQSGNAGAFPKLVNMWRTGRGCDVTIACKNDETIKAHSIVLCSVSDKLDELLTLSHTDKLISSPDVEMLTWKCLLEIIYTGSYLSINEGDVQPIEKAIALAESLGMDNIVAEYNRLSVVELMGETNIALLGEDKDGGNISILESAGPSAVFDVLNPLSSDNSSAVVQIINQSGKGGLISIPNNAETHVIVETVERSPVRKKVCYGCHSDCSTKKVKCILCLKVVDNDISHMDTVHPFTPKTSNFVFTCNFFIEEADSRDWMVCRKSYKKLYDEIGNQLSSQEVTTLYDYECCLCASTYSTLNEVVGHIKIQHQVITRLCKICQTGFESGLVCRDHEYFCNGGELMKCLDCDKVLGGLHTLASHQATHRKERQCQGIDENEQLNEIGLKGKRRRKAKRKEKCLKCGSNCKSERVRCMYCFAVERKQGRHMDDVHPFTPNENAWMYTCKNLPAEAPEDKAVICSKEFISESNCQHRCYKCWELFSSNEEVDTHLRKEHNILARICKVCNMGFLKEYHLKDHEHFCTGGKFLHCQICLKKIGGVRALKDHMNRNHEKGEEPVTVDMETEDPAQIIEKPSYLCDSLPDADSVISSFINKSEKINPKTPQKKIKSPSDLEIESTSQRRSRRKVTTNLKYKDYLTDFNTSMIKKEPQEDDSDSDEMDYGQIEGKKPARKRSNNNKRKLGETEFNDHYRHKSRKFIAGKQNQVKCVDTFLHKFEHFVKSEKLELTSKEGKTAIKIDVSEGVCSHCAAKCNAPEVRCFYCCKIVKNEISHKDICHSFSNEKSIWIYSCQLDDEKSSKTDESVIFEKESYHKKVNIGDPKKLHLYQFKCLTCESLFASIEDMQGHVICKYKCNKCKLYFTKLDQSIKHVEKYHKHDCFVCEQCESGFTDKNYAEEHEYFCKGGSPLECKECGVKFWNFGRLEHHIEAEHTCEQNEESPVQTTLVAPVDEAVDSKLSDGVLESEKTITTKSNNANKAVEFHSELERDGEWPLDDEDNDPDYVEENVNDDGEEDDDDINEDIHEDADVSGYETTNEGKSNEVDKPKKRGHGRPRKSLNTSEVKTKKSGPVTEEDFCNLHKDKFNIVETSREWVHTKMCYTCGDSCSAETVKCGYCGMVLDIADKFNHMQELHPLIPPTCVWPVNCRFFKLNIQIPEVVAKQVVEFEVVKDEEGNLTQYAKGQGVYICTICDKIKNCDSVAEMEEHLIEYHNVKGVMCKQCGLWLKASCSNLITDHNHFCAGGDFKSCIECGKYIGSWKNADIHVKRVHLTTIRKKRKCNKPTYKSYMSETDGKYGYKILCADCNGTCKNAPVKCALCHEIVIKDDIHMKLKHPYSLCKTWIVFCRYAMHASNTPSNPLVEYLGEKVPTVSQDDLLNEGEIPSKHPFHYKCNHCQMYFLQRKYLKMHVKKEHVEPAEKEKQQTGLFTFSCKSCEALLYGRSYFFQDHAHFCSTGELHRCEHCSERCCGLQKLNQHYKVKHNDVYSKRQKQRKVSLRVSNSVVELPEGTELKCIECSFTTQLIKGMKDHNRNVHNWRGLQLTQFCRFCFQVFKIRSDRERHEQTLHLDGQRALCEVCGEDFEIPLQLERHDYYVHRGGREYVSLKQKQERANATVKVCQYCTKEYSSQAKLNRHIKVVHDQTLVIKCHICGKNFCSQSSLKVHLDRHTGNRNAKCPYCPYMDFRGYMINNHVQIEHPGKEKPFKRNLVFQNTKEELEYEDDRQEEIVYEIADNANEVIFQVPNQQIEVKQVEMDQTVEEAVAAGNVLLEYYVVQ